MPREKSPSTPTPKRAPRKPTVKLQTKKTAAIVSVAGLEKRTALIAEAAFFRAEKRGFAPGSELEDWLAAESEVDARS